MASCNQGPITVSELDGVLVAVVERKLLDSEGCDTIRQALFDATADVCRPVVIDLSQVSFLPSMAIGILLNVRAHLQQTGCALVLAGLRPALKQVLTITQLNRLLLQADTVADAITLARSGGPSAVGGR